MKSLGMSSGQIAWTIAKEAILLSFLGVVSGVVLTFVTRFLLSLVTTLEVEMSPLVLSITLVVGLIGGALGSLYPALRAARHRRDLRVLSDLMSAGRSKRTGPTFQRPAGPKGPALRAKGRPSSSY